MKTSSTVLYNQSLSFVLSSMMIYLVLVLLLPSSNAWFNFNFKLAHKTYGLDGKN